MSGGEGGIRTLEGLLTLTPLAGARLRPLGHLSVSGYAAIRGARDNTRLEQSRQSELWEPKRLFQASSTILAIGALVLES
jgi:hypothetical protein